jgi:hypothetical protein
MSKIEAKRTAETKAAEPKRKEEIAKQRTDFVKAAKEQKAKKRRVSVEIASGLVDLLLDLGSEVYDVMRASENKKLTKEDWREFMTIFKDGKKASLRKVVKKVIDPSLVSDQNEIPFRVGVTADEIMVQYLSEPALTDFYQFLCGTGQFDL